MRKFQLDRLAVVVATKLLAAIETQLSTKKLLLQTTHDGTLSRCNAANSTEKAATVITSVAKSFILAVSAVHAAVTR